MPLKDRWWKWEGVGKKKNTAPMWFEKQEKILGAKGGSWYLGPRGMRMTSGEDSTMRNFIVCTVHLK